MNAAEHYQAGQELLTRATDPKARAERRGHDGRVATGPAGQSVRDAWTRQAEAHFHAADTALRVEQMPGTDWNVKWVNTTGWTEVLAWHPGS